MAKYAVIEAKGHQYWVEENSIIEVEKLDNADTKEVTLNQVLLVTNDGDTKIGQPFVANAAVVCDVLGEAKQPKVVSFKFKRRKGYRRKVGHRQMLIRLKVKTIQVG